MQFLATVTAKVGVWRINVPLLTIDQRLARFGSEVALQTAEHLNVVDLGFLHEDIIWRVKDEVRAFEDGSDVREGFLAEGLLLFQFDIN